MTDEDKKRLVEIHETQPVTALAKRTGLPYRLVYNIVHGRVKSISEPHYRAIFGPAAPLREPKRVGGATFRAMVALWLYLNDDATMASLYREFYGPEHAKKPDLRVFNGRTRTVEFGLEQRMRQKFAQAGIPEPLLERWLEEIETLPRDEWIHYARIKPVLDFLEKTMGVHPTFLLNQSVNRYEKGQLKRVSLSIFERAMAFKRKAQKALASGGNREIEKLREEIYGAKSGYTLYLKVEEELQFLRKYAQKSAKGYLGRGLGSYQKGKVKRIADWRAKKILQDCGRFIREKPNLRLLSLPRSQQAMQIRMLVDVLVLRATELLSGQEGMVVEKRILSPLHTGNEYKNQHLGFTRFDRAFNVLGMKKKAFDLMVAKNCEIFRAVGRYANQWYLPDQYLKELSQKELFDLISAKYELMAKKLSQPDITSSCMH